MPIDNVNQGQGVGQAQGKGGKAQTVQEQYVQQLAKDLQSNPDIAKALGHKPNEQEIQNMLFQLVHPEQEGSSKLAAALAEVQQQAESDLKNKLGSLKGFNPKGPQVLLAVLKKYVPSGKFNQAVKTLAKQMNLSEAQTKQLLSLYSNPKNLSSIDPNLSKALFGKLEQVATKPANAIALEPPVNFASGQDQISSAKATQTPKPSLPTNEKVPQLIPGKILTQNDIKNLQSWFGPSMLTALFENILNLINAMKKMQMVETKVSVMMTQCTLSTASDTAALIKDSAKVESSMLKAEAKKDLSQAHVMMVAAYVGLACGIAGSVLGMFKRGQAAGQFLASGSQFATTFAEATNKITEANFLNFKATGVVTKAMYDATSEFMRNIIGIFQQEASRAAESRKQLQDEINQLIQTYEKVAEQHYQSIHFNKG